MANVDGNRVLIFAPQYNRPPKKDATGAFQPEARRFAELHGIPESQLIIVDNHASDSEMRGVVLGAISARQIQAQAPLAAVAFFCHGQGGSIQLGFDRNNLEELAAPLAGVNDVRVMLYACSTATTPGADDEERMAAVGGDGGFADGLRDALCQAGAVECQVDAHSTAGHTTRNPFVRRFQGMGRAFGGAGGFMLVSKSEKTLWHKWRMALKESDLRYKFPFMTVAEIHAAL